MVSLEEDEESMKLQKIEETTQLTMAALEKMGNVKLSAMKPRIVPAQSQASTCIKYKPSRRSAAFNSGASYRIIRMFQMPVNPLEFPKFQVRKIPMAKCSFPVPVLRSPTRPATFKEQQDWKIPPCISNWKNPKGYTIPLDKRLAAGGRCLRVVQISGRFAKFSEALCVAEHKAREAVEMRSKVQKELILKEKARKELELRALAQRARFERTGIAPGSAVPIPKSVLEDDADDDGITMAHGQREVRLIHDKILVGRKRGRERERRLEAKDASAGKKRKITRDRDRDISEKVALGMANTGARRDEVKYDQRLFNQDKGMEFGFAAEDQYNIYDKGIFAAQPTLSTLYKPKKDIDFQMYGGAKEQLQKIVKTDRFKPDKQEENDPFGLDQFLTEVEKGSKAMAEVSGCAMRDSAAYSIRGCG